MPVRNWSRRPHSFVLCAAGLLLAGCAAGEQPATQPRSTAFQAPTHAASRNFIYVVGGGEIWVFPEMPNAPPIESISIGVNGPYGLYVDGKGNLYVANDGNNTVTVYPPGSLTPSATYSRNLSRPLFPIVDSSGNLFVTNAGDGTVTEYVGGNSTGPRTFYTFGVEADGIGFDRSGYLYVAYRNAQGTGSVERFAPGRVRGRSLGMSLDQPEGLAVSSSGKILVVETAQLNRMDEFPRGSRTPDFIIDVPQVPVQLAMTQSEDRIFVSTLSGAVYFAPYPLKSLQLTQEIYGNYYGQGVALSNEQHF